MRVCIVAEHASFKFGGEAVLPLHYFTRLRARGIETWLVVHSRTRPELSALFPEESDHILFVEDRWFHKLLFHLSSLFPRRVAESTTGLLNQIITQALARRMILRLVADRRIDVVHQPIPVSPRFPSLMAHLGVPVVIGPMNGGMEYPPAFRRHESFVTRVAVRLGRRLSGIANSLLPGKKLARVLLVANERTRLALPSCARGETVKIPENGVNLKIWTGQVRPAQPDAPEALRPTFVFVGRLVDWKRVDIAIQALALVPGARLKVIGSGPMLTRWSALAETLGLNSRVDFLGWLPHEDLAPHLRSALALVLPSLYESGGAVVLEAMAAGTAVIATRWGGPTDYLDDSCGMLVEPDGDDELVCGFARAMQALAVNPQIARSMGASGRERAAREFDWEKKINQILEAYEKAMQPANGALNR